MHTKHCFLSKQGRPQTISSGGINTCTHHFLPLRVRALSVSCQRFWHWMINSSLPERQPCLGDSGVHASFVTLISPLLVLFQVLFGIQGCKTPFPLVHLLLSACVLLFQFATNLLHPLPLFFYKTYGTNQIIGEELTTVLTHTHQ